MKVRLAAVQYGLRRVSGFEAFEEQVRFFGEHAAEAHADVLVFPELLTTQLLSIPGTPTEPAKAMRSLLDHTDDYIRLFKTLAKETGVHILGGTHPTEADSGRLRNTAFFFTPAGDVIRQDKIHLTPWEAEYWEMEGGDRLAVIETPKAKMGILVCYDSEFPELARILCDHDVDVLLVPASTEDKRGFIRVRDCCAARAIENQVYVVQTGTVGLLPRVAAMRTNTSKATIHTPSDYPFPWDAIATEAEFNEESIILADVDLNLLQEVRERGSVTNFRDRRPELYDVVSKMPVDIHRSEKPLAEEDAPWVGGTGPG